MIKLINVLALLAAIASPVQASAGNPSVDKSAQATTPPLARIVDYAKKMGGRTLIYSEYDDKRPDGKAVTGVMVLSQRPDTKSLAMLDRRDPAMNTLLPDLTSDAKAAGWRWIAIVVDNGEATIDRGPSPGGIEGFNKRLKAEADRVFPGHNP